MVASDAPDVLLADLSMPEVDGFTLMRQVRAVAYLIPAAALTAYRGADQRGRAEEAGYGLFLEKPIAVDELTKKLAELASRDRSRRPSSQGESDDGGEHVHLWPAVCRLAGRGRRFTRKPAWLRPRAEAERSSGAARRGRRASAFSRSSTARP